MGCCGRTDQGHASVSDFLTRAREHQSASNELQYLAIPELGENFGIYYKNFVTVQQKSAIFADMEDGAITYDCLLTALMERALNEDGSRAIPPIERKEVANALSASVLERIIASMGGVIEDVDPKG